MSDSMSAARSRQIDLTFAAKHHADAEALNEFLFSLGKVTPAVPECIRQAYETFYRLVLQKIGEHINLATVWERAAAAPKPASKQLQRSPDKRPCSGRKISKKRA